MTWMICGNYMLVDGKFSIICPSHPKAYFGTLARGAQSTLFGFSSYGLSFSNQVSQVH